MATTRVGLRKKLSVRGDKPLACRPFGGNKQAACRHATRSLACALAGLLCCLGCAQTMHPQAVQSSPPVTLRPADSPGGVQLVQHTELPAPQTLNSHPAGATADQGGKVLPINLDTVFRLAQDQNGQIQLAREQVNEAFAGKALADKGWLPDIDVGLSYCRHEGGIQDVDGQFFHSSFGSLFAGVEIRSRLDLHEVVFQKIDAERKTWQQRGELSRLSSEALLDAANTYIDLLTARTGAVISQETEEKIQKVLEQAKKLAATEKGLQVEVHRVQAQLTAQQQITRELQGGARSAAAKLLQLLGLDPHAKLAVMDPKLVAFPLIPAGTSTDELVAHALSNGPGVRELEGLLDLIARADAQSQGLSKFLPVFEVKVAEGAFGAGPGDDNRWDNRLDMSAAMRWNLSSLCTAKERQWAAHSKMQQAHLSYQNLRARLTLGVQEAVEASASNAEQILMAQKQIDEAREAFKLSEFRLTNLPGTAPSEVLLAARSVAGAQLGYLNALRDFDKAQIRLLILTGQGPGCVPQ